MAGGRRLTRTLVTLIKALNGKRTFNYLYDFGDSWHHSTKVEKTLPAIACPQAPYFASMVPMLAHRFS